MYYAADKVIEKAKKVAAHMLEVAETDIVFGDGAFSVAGTDRSAGIQRRRQQPAKLPPGEPGLPETGDLCTGRRHLSEWQPCVRGRNRSETGETDVVGYWG